MLFRLIAMLGFILFAGTAHAADSSVLKTQKDKVSYSIGLDMGRTLKSQAMEVDPEMVARGLRDALSNKKPLMTEEEIQKVMMEAQKQKRALTATESRALGEKNLKEGAAFLAENKKKKGVVTLPSGLQYKIITEGNGKKPKATDTVTTHYRGTLIDGTEFDNSYKRGRPERFPLNGVIPGWTEALQLMPAGSKWELFIPSDLAYGPRGSGSQIGP
ncbi:MAG TPA: FKBP-type peptidyl-prolyl cis-trans isomerase, partial [Candidatus Manganitrophaceae bacterium]|nr:FKBP-type peptidyl-prolyl cis-trans isomerase [Candidatus Manganitrophaceae bacterium]